MADKRFLTPKETVEYLTEMGLKMSLSDLLNKRVARDKNSESPVYDIGPVFHRFGVRKISYDKTHVDAWISACCSTSTPIEATAEPTAQTVELEI